MVRDMPPVRNLTPGHTVIHPNRDKAESKALRAIVVFLLLACVPIVRITRRAAEAPPVREEAPEPT